MAAQSKRPRLSRRTNPHGRQSSTIEHRLFLSATPHNGHSNSFSRLLEILDPQRFCRGVPVKQKLLEYRQAQVWTGGYAPRQLMEGWVLPAERDGARRFAILWNGIVSPVEEIGAAADVPAAIKPRLLLRLGKTDLAERLAATIKDVDHPYLFVARDWTNLR